MHISADVQRITFNASCVTISGERTKQLDIFCRVTVFTSDFLKFHSCGTYSVLSRSPSTVCLMFTLTQNITNATLCVVLSCMLINTVELIELLCFGLYVHNVTGSLYSYVKVT